MRYQAALHSDKSGGDEWDRTTDLMRMKQLLCQLSYITIVERTVMCLVGSFKFLPPDRQAFQFMIGRHKFSPNNGRSCNWRFVSLTVGIPLLYLTRSTMVPQERLELSRLRTGF